MSSDEQLYEEIVFHSAALLISKAGNAGTSKILEKILAAAILQENISVGQVALDIWTLFARYFC